MATLNEVTDMLTKRVTGATETADNAPIPGEDQPGEVNGEETDIIDATSGDDEPDPKHADADDREGTEGGDGEAEEEPQEVEGSEDDQYIDLDDDVIVQLTVDGQPQEATLADLKASFSKGTAAQKRLQEASELRNRYKATMDKALEETEAVRQPLIRVLEEIESAIATPLVSEPDVRLKSSNPGQYLRHLEAYQADQKRVNDAQSLIKTQLETHAKSVSELREKRKQAQLEALREKLPALVDPKTQQQASQDLFEAAKHYGFSDAEISSFADHRLYVMAYDAQMYRKLQQGKMKAPTQMDEPNKVSKGRRILRSGKTTAKTARSTADKQRQAARARATKTGKPSDVAAYLAEKHKS